MFHAYDQVAVHVYSYWHNRRYIFCPGSFGYCKHRFIPTQYVLEIEICFLNLPQSMFQVVFGQEIFNLQ